MTQAERNKERREFYKAHGICCQCGREKATKGRSYCLNCLDKISISGYKYRATWSEEKKAEYLGRAAKYHKRLYNERKATGICVDCGKKKAEENRVRCGICLDKQRRRQEKIRRQNDNIIPRALYGVDGNCACCGGPVRGENEKCCERCYEKITKAGVKGRANIDYKAHRWRAENSIVFKNNKGGRCDDKQENKECEL